MVLGVNAFIFYSSPYTLHRQWLFLQWPWLIYRIIFEDGDVFLKTFNLKKIFFHQRRNLHHRKVKMEISTPFLEGEGRGATSTKPMKSYGPSKWNFLDTIMINLWFPTLPREGSEAIFKTLGLILNPIPTATKKHTKRKAGGSLSQISWKDFCGKGAAYSVTQLAYRADDYPTNKFIIHTKITFRGITFQFSVFSRIRQTLSFTIMISKYPQLEAQ